VTWGSGTNHARRPTQRWAGGRPNRASKPGSANTTIRAIPAGVTVYVFSAALDQAVWANSTLVRGDAVAEVTRLRQQDGPDLVLYGHGSLAQTLREHGLIDEFRFALHPVLAGRGQLLFQEGAKTPLTLVGAETLSTGTVVLSYQPA
jgi:dihydrofolate reductase